MAGEFGGMADEVFRLFGIVALNRADVEDDLEAIERRFKRTADSAQRELRKIGEAMETHVIRGVAAAAAAVTGFGVLSARNFAQFEQRMSNVAAVSGATEEQLRSLTEQAQELGATTKFTAADAAEGMQFLAMAGFQVNEIMGAMPSVLQLAASANIDLASAADITTNILTGYGLQVEELTRANDVLVKALTSANVNLVQLGEAFKYVGPIARTAGVQFEETAAAIALMGNAGIQGSLAGTALRGAITRLLDPTNEAAAVMQRLGLDVTDSEGRLRSLVEIVEQLERSGADTADMMTLFGLRAGPAMAALVSQGSAALRDFAQALRESEGIAARIERQQLDNLAGDYEELTSAVDGLTIAVGQRLSPTLRKWTQDATRWVLDVQDRVVDFFGRAIDLADQFLTRLANLSEGTRTFLAVVAGSGATFAVLATAINRTIALVTQLTTLIAGAGGLRAALVALAGPGGTIALVGAALTGGIILWQRLQKSVSDTAAELRRSIETTIETARSMQEQIDELDRLIARYDELSGKPELSSEEHEELRRVIDRIVQLAPQAVIGYNDMGEALIGNADKARKFRDELQRTLRQTLEVTAREAEVRLPFLEAELEKLLADLQRTNDAAQEAREKMEQAIATNERNINVIAIDTFRRLFEVRQAEAARLAEEVRNIIEEINRLRTAQAQLNALLSGEEAEKIASPEIATEAVQTAQAAGDAYDYIAERVRLLKEELFGIPREERVRRALSAIVDAEDLEAQAQAMIEFQQTVRDVFGELEHVAEAERFQEFLQSLVAPEGFPAHLYLTFHLLMARLQREAEDRTRDLRQKLQKEVDAQIEERRRKERQQLEDDIRFEEQLLSQAVQRIRREGDLFDLPPGEIARRLEIALQVAMQRFRERFDTEVFLDLGTIASIEHEIEMLRKEQEKLDFSARRKEAEETLRVRLAELDVDKQIAQILDQPIPLDEELARVRDILAEARRLADQGLVDESFLRDLEQRAAMIEAHLEAERLARERQVQQVLTDLERQMAIAEAQSQALGSQFDLNARKAELLRDAIMELIALGVDPLDERVQKLVADLNSLSLDPLEQEFRRTLDGIGGTISRWIVDTTAEIFGGTRRWQELFKDFGSVTSSVLKSIFGTLVSHIMKTVVAQNTWLATTLANIGTAIAGFLAQAYASLVAFYWFLGPGAPAAAAATMAVVAAAVAEWAGRTIRFATGGGDEKDKDEKDKDDGIERTVGRRIVEITGPSRDLLVDLLTPLARLDEQTGILGRIYNVLDERLPNFNQLAAAGAAAAPVSVTFEPGAIQIVPPDGSPESIGDGLIEALSERLGDVFAFELRGVPAT